jgi:hypothetical protein
VAAAWLAVWAPAYAIYYEPINFLALCDVAVVLTCIGLWSGSALLLSAQALSSLVIDSTWVIDVLARLATGRHLIGGTEYMWDPQFPLWLRLLSLFHVAWPPLLLYAVRTTGYDRRALAAQSALTGVLLVASRLLSTPAENLNYAWADPFLKRSWGPAPLHLALMLGLLVLVVYGPTHAGLRRFAGPPR